MAPRHFRPSPIDQPRSFFLPSVEDVTTSIHNDVNTVAPAHAPDVPIDTDWAQLLTRIRLQVRNSW